MTNTAEQISSVINKMLESVASKTIAPIEFLKSHYTMVSSGSSIFFVKRGESKEKVATFAIGNPEAAKEIAKYYQENY